MSGGFSFGALATVAAATILPKLLAPKPQSGAAPVAAPTVAAPTAMPTAGDAATNEAKRASIAEQLKRRGRASTILSDTGATDTLGA